MLCVSVVRLSGCSGSVLLWGFLEWLSISSWLIRCCSCVNLVSVFDSVSCCVCGLCWCKEFFSFICIVVSGVCSWCVVLLMKCCCVVCIVFSCCNSVLYVCIVGYSLCGVFCVGFSGVNGFGRGLVSFCVIRLVWCVVVLVFDYVSYVVSVRIVVWNGMLVSSSLCFSWWCLCSVLVMCSWMLWFGLVLIMILIMCIGCLCRCVL